MKFITSCLVALIATLGQVATVSAEPICSEGMIANTYGLVGETIIPDIGYCGITGTMTLKEDGTTKGRIKQSCAGMTQSSMGTGTFTVKRNCTGTADVAFDDGTSGVFHFVVTEGGRTLLFIGDQQPGITFTGWGKRL